MVAPAVPNVPTRTAVNVLSEPELTARVELELNLTSVTLHPDPVTVMLPLNKPLEKALLVPPTLKTDVLTLSKALFEPVRVSVQVPRTRFENLLFDPLTDKVAIVESERIFE